MTIDNPIQILTHEHKYILKVVYALRVIDEDLNRSKQVDVELIQRVV